jgi:hypothetical protein
VGIIKADTKTGGIYMHIHSYQIHNILNDYRKQLRHWPRGNGSKNPRSDEGLDRISISKDGQRQSIMEKISADIVDRITQAGPDNRFETAIATRHDAMPIGRRVSAAGEAPEFKYTVIDENNRKQTNSFIIQQFNPSHKRSEPALDDDNGKNTLP